MTTRFVFSFGFCVLLISVSGCATLCNMLAPRTARSSWFRDDDGVLTKPVDEDASYVDSIDLTDELEEHQAITPSWDDVSGVTLGTPSVVGGVVSFTHHGTGYAVLQALCDFAAYLATLPSVAYYDATHRISLLGFPGPGASVGDTVFFNVGPDPTGAPCVTGLGGFYATVLTASGVWVRAGPLVWNAGSQKYTAVLLDALAAADDTVDAQIVLISSVPTLEDPDTAYGQYTTYSAKPTKTVRVPLRFVDPSNPTQDYTP